MALIASKATEKRKPPFLPDEILEKLKCSDCNGFLSTPPIMKHPVLGSICGNCAEYNTNSKFIRNIEYELIAAYIEFPCRNQGCHKRILFGKFLEHELNCQFRPYECPLNLECHWIGSFHKLGTHFAENHKELLIFNGKFVPNLIKNCEQVLLDIKDNNFFLVQSKCVIRDCKFWCLVRYIGRPKNNEILKYKLEFLGDVTNKSYITQEKSVLTDICLVMDTNLAIEINISAMLEALDYPLSVTCTAHVHSTKNIS